MKKILKGKNNSNIRGSCKVNRGRRCRGVDDLRIKRKIDRDVNLVVVMLTYETDALLTFGVYKIEICGIGEASDCFA